MKRYEHQTTDLERALYGIRDAEVIDYCFAGPADGESALKECKNVRLQDCRFMLRYPLWHLDGGAMTDCTMLDSCRAALWYDRDLLIRHSELSGIKALRECDHVTLEDCSIDSQEFGWFCRDVQLKSCTLRSEYPFLQSRRLALDHLELTGKYSFQYVEDVVIRNSTLNTKDAFWHSKNVTVIDSVIKGEYLAWYSENLKLIRCKIIGTQPLCYAKGLVLEDCEMEDCDLAFENSEVQATVRGRIDSVKNPHTGFITADEIGEILLDEYRWPAEQPCLIRETR